MSREFYETHARKRKVNLEEIRGYVEEKGIQAGKSTWSVAHPRFFLCAYLRKNTDLKLREIADLVGYKQHDNVIHAIKKHDEYVTYKDKIYLENIKGVKRFLSTGEFNYEAKDLREEILKANSLIELHQIQGYIKKGIL